MAEGACWLRFVFPSHSVEWWSEVAAQPGSTYLHLYLPPAGSMYLSLYPRTCIEVIYAHCGHGPSTTPTHDSLCSPSPICWLEVDVQRNTGCHMVRMAGVTSVSGVLNASAGLTIHFSNQWNFPCTSLCAQSSSRVWLFAIPWAVALQAPLFLGFPKQEYWSGLSFPSLDFPWVGYKFLIYQGCKISRFIEDSS